LAYRTRKLIREVVFLGGAQANGFSMVAQLCTPKP
jgi:hypothetical protein